MSHDGPIMELLVRWKEMRRAGIAAHPEDLCRDCPEMVEELKQRIQQEVELEQLPATNSYLMPRQETVPQIQLAGYVVERVLGEGGMGIVYLVASMGEGHRFAMKMARFPDAASQRNFRAELQTWMDLPKHPHLAACYFYRPIGEETAVFAEYLEGGSLADWIRQRRLTTIEQILDIAIQFAWGLQAAHETGLVHQDVKPGNVLMTRDATAKVADFGLARARTLAPGPAATAQHAQMVTLAGMTPAYCSPEQAAGHRLTHKTDMWSWAVSVLEIFTGKVTWKNGPAALEALERCLAIGARSPHTVMPRSIAEILGKCFRQDPEDRWPTMAALTLVLMDRYRDLVGREYPRPVPIGISKDRPKSGRSWWANARGCIYKALNAAGLDPAEAKQWFQPERASLDAQILADLDLYTEAYRLWSEVVPNGKKTSDFAHVCLDKAKIHVACGDYLGARDLTDEAIRTYQDLLRHEERPEMAADLNAALQQRSGLLERTAWMAVRQHLSTPQGKQASTQKAAAVTRTFFEDVVAKANAANRRLYLSFLGAYLFAAILAMVAWATASKIAAVLAVLGFLSVFTFTIPFLPTFFLSALEYLFRAKRKPEEAARADFVPEPQQGATDQDPLLMAEDLYRQERWQEARVVFERILGDERYADRAEYVRRCLASLDKKQAR